MLFYKEKPVLCKTGFGLKYYINAKLNLIMEALQKQERFNGLFLSFFNKGR